MDVLSKLDAARAAQHRRAGFRYRGHQVGQQRQPGGRQQRIFTVTAHNLGPDPASSVQLTDLLPAGLTFVSATASQGTYTPGTGVWNLGPLAFNATATLQITATVTGTTQVTNTATRTGTTPADPVPGNDSASSRVTGSTIPGLPNNGAPPLAPLLPDAAAILILLAAFGARRLRSRPTPDR